MVRQSIIILAILSKFVYYYRGNNTFVVQENSGQVAGLIHHQVQILNLVWQLVGQLQLHGGNIKLIGHMTSSISYNDSREKDSNRPWMMSLRSLMASRRILKRIFLASSDIKLTTRWGPIFAFSLLKLSLH